jgi:AcrR family transcriptional regulator
LTVGPNAPEIEARIVARRNRRLIGRDGDRCAVASLVPEGPDLIGAATPMVTPSARSEPIRTKLLDVAELLFSRWGYTGVSVRDVTDLAEMRLANVTYYFGSKQNLYFEVLRRRAEPLSAARIEAIAKLYDFEGTTADFLDQFVAAYMDPALNLAMTGGEGWENFFRLIGHIAYSRLWPHALARYYNDAAYRFIGALQRQFPEKPAAVIQSAVLMMVGPSMYTLARTGRVETFSDPAFSSDNLEFLGPQTKAFITGGLHQLLKR